MPQTPYAKLTMRINGGSLVSGSQVLTGGQVIQLRGENTASWENQLWEIYDYPPDFPCPVGWTNINGIYISNALQPADITLGDADPDWGKYLLRLTVNQGLLNGVQQGPGATQPLVDESSGISVYSPNLSLRDVAYGEGNQFDPARQWVGQFKDTLRQIDSGGVGGGGPGDGESLSPEIVISGNVAVHNSVGGSPKHAEDRIEFFDHDSFPTYNKPVALSQWGRRVTTNATPTNLFVAKPSIDALVEDGLVSVTVDVAYVYRESGNVRGGNISKKATFTYKSGTGFTRIGIVDFTEAGLITGTAVGGVDILVSGASIYARATGIASTEITWVTSMSVQMPQMTS